MTIENKTSFQRLRDGDSAMMYLGGFANRHQIEFLKKVISDNPNVRYYHFGDIDIGGFLIRKHLCRETAKNKVLWINLRKLKEYFILQFKIIYAKLINVPLRNVPDRLEVMSWKQRVDFILRK